PAACQPRALPTLLSLPPYCFLFSSRRRHTIFSRDWSSDVCSSDLDRLLVAVPEDPPEQAIIVFAATPDRSDALIELMLLADALRPEERRGGQGGIIGGTRQE